MGGVVIQLKLSQTEQQQTESLKSPEKRGQQLLLRRSFSPGSGLKWTLTKNRSKIKTQTQRDEKLRWRLLPLLLLCFALFFLQIFLKQKHRVAFSSRIKCFTASWQNCFLSTT